MAKDYDAVLGTTPPSGGHTSASQHDRPYSHFNKSPGGFAEGSGDFGADADAAEEKQTGMMDDNKLPRSSSGAVIGSQKGAKDPGPKSGVQNTAWGEFTSLDQWDKEQSGTYDNDKD